MPFQPDVPRTSANPRVLSGRGKNHAPKIALLSLAAFTVAAAGFHLGYRLADTGPSPVVFEGGALVAAGELESVLYEPSLGEREEGPSVGEAFRDETGKTCRNFLDGPVEGTACQAQGDWRVVELRQKPRSSPPAKAG